MAPEGAAPPSAPDQARRGADRRGLHPAGGDARRVRRALAALLEGAVGEDVVGRARAAGCGPAGRRGAPAASTARTSSGSLLDGTGLRARAGRKATAIALRVAVGVRRDGETGAAGAQGHGRRPERARARGRPWRAGARGGAGGAVARPPGPAPHAPRAPRPRTAPPLRARGGLLARLPPGRRRPARPTDAAERPHEGLRRRIRTRELSRPGPRPGPDRDAQARGMGHPRRAPRPAPTRRSLPARETATPPRRRPRHPMPTTSRQHRGGCCVRVLRRGAGGLHLHAMTLLGPGGRDAPDGLEQPAVVGPAHPLEGGGLHRPEAAPRTAAADHLGLEEPDHRLGRRAVERVPDRAHGGFDAGLGTVRSRRGSASAFEVLASSSASLSRLSASRAIWCPPSAPIRGVLCRLRLSRVRSNIALARCSRDFTVTRRMLGGACSGATPPPRWPRRRPSRCFCALRRAHMRSFSASGPGHGRIGIFVRVADRRSEPDGIGHAVPGRARARMRSPTEVGRAVVPHPAGRARADGTPLGLGARGRGHAVRRSVRPDPPGPIRPRWMT